MKAALALTLSLGLAGVALAQAPPATTPPAPVPDFASIDANKDGKISQSEVDANASLKSEFAALDADRDTYLTPSEYSKYKGVKPDMAKPRSEIETPKAE